MKIEVSSLDKKLFNIKINCNHKIQGVRKDNYLRLKKIKKQ